MNTFMDWLFNELMVSGKHRRHDTQHTIFNYWIINIKGAAGREKELQTLYYLQLFADLQK
jgi:hypothetical protein